MVRVTRQDREKWGGSWQAESHLEGEEERWAFGVSAQMRAKGRHCAGQLPQEQSTSGGLGKDMATQTQTEAKHPGITGL